MTNSVSFFSISFRVVHMTSEDSGYPAEELNVHSPSTRGWQSVKFSEYPQELGFELIGNNTKLSQVQILSHQSKIATKIEIFIGSGSDYHSARFSRLGYLSLDSNERSSFQARELKTVYVDHDGNFIRFIIHRNYVNKENIFNQVGIVAVNFSGSEDTGIDLNLDGPGSVDKRIAASKNPLNDLSIDLNLDPQTASKLRLLSEAKARAVATEDYVTAKQIKTVEMDLKSLGARLAQLDIAKQAAVKSEDYDRAKEIKDETDELRAEIEEKVMAVHIPGVTDIRRAPEIPRFAPAKASPVPEADYRRAGGPGPGEGPSPVNASYATRPSPMVPLNIDELPVGGGAGRHDPYGVEPALSARGAKMSDGRRAGPGLNSQEPSPYTYDDGGGGYDDVNPGADRRPIRPKANASYTDRDPDIGEPDEAMQEAGDEFEPGFHPLEGVPNLSTLPTPEELSGKAKETSDQGGITALMGDYRARCLFSKVWALREAAISKAQMLLQDEWEHSPGVSSCLSALLSIVRVGVDDKIQQVFFNALNLLDSLMGSAKRARISRATATPLADPILNILIEKLSDGNARIREGAKKGIDMLAAASSVGPHAVAAHALRALSAKQKTAWRPILVRLQVLTDIINTYGLGPAAGVSAETAMNFCKTYGAFAHSNGEVRDGARDLTVAVYKHVGAGPLDLYIQALRTKQKEEYQAAFEAADKGGGGGGGGPSSPRGKEGAAHGNHVAHNHGGKVDTSAAKAGNKWHQEEEYQQPQKQKQQQQAQHKQEDDGAGADDFMCTFCGAGDTSWNEDVLDLHYLKDCPLLAPCPACAQVLEIAALPDHLLEECEHKAEFAPCDTTGLAIRVTELDAWKASPSCVPPPENCFYCPLCVASVEDSNEAWKQHLLSGCPRNTRTHG